MSEADYFKRRNAAILALHRQGASLADLAYRYALTRERIRQIVTTTTTSTGSSADPPESS